GISSLLISSGDSLALMGVSSKSLLLSVSAFLATSGVLGPGVGGFSSRSLSDSSRVTIGATRAPWAYREPCSWPWRERTARLCGSRRRDRCLPSPSRGRCPWSVDQSAAQPRRAVPGGCRCPMGSWLPLWRGADRYPPARRERSSHRCRWPDRAERCGLRYRSPPSVCPFFRTPTAPALPPF